jgi:hypothetical protein
MGANHPASNMVRDPGRQIRAEVIQNEELLFYEAQCGLSTESKKYLSACPRRCYYSC